MKVVILAGGLGTRLSEETVTRPKPMVEIGGHPILWHIMKYYAGFAHTEFCVALGYRGRDIKQYFLNYSLLATPDVTVELGTGNVSARGYHPDDWKVHLVDTGLQTMTGGRLKRLSSYVSDGTFMLTYGDGLSNVDLEKLVAFHRSHGRLATVTAVRPPARFGDLRMDGDVVAEFIEKPRSAEGWINGGFFVFEPGVLDFMEDDTTVLERQPLARLAQQGQLRAYKHDGFWQCMDTARDLRVLEEHWAGGGRPGPSASMPSDVKAADPKRSDWRGRRVLVTGATGIVGSWLCRDLLERGAGVVVLVRDHDPQSELYRSGDVARTTVVTGALEDYATVERALNEYEVRTVFHLGAQTIVGTALRSPLQTFKSNIEGSWNLLEASRRLDGLVENVVVASSDKAYGEQPALPYHEDMPLLASHPYDVSKSCTDLLARTYAVTYGLQVAIARCGNIYGGGDLNWSRIVPGTIRSLLDGERPIVRSDGTFVRDYLYVRDAVAAYVALAESVHREDVCGEAFNFSTESWVTVLEIVDAIRKAVGSDLQPDVRNEARAEIPSQSLSADKARRVLGWKPGWDLDAGLAETVAWYREYLGAR